MMFDFSHVDMTIGTITSPLATGLLLFLFARYLDRKDKIREEKEEERTKDHEKKEKALADLIIETERLKETAVKERWSAYNEKILESQRILCSIKEDIAMIKETAHDKVDWGSCKDRMQELAQNIKSANHHVY